MLRRSGGGRAKPRHFAPHCAPASSAWLKLSASDAGERADKRDAMGCRRSRLPLNGAGFGGRARRASRFAPRWVPFHRRVIPSAVFCCRVLISLCVYRFCYVRFARSLVRSLARSRRATAFILAALSWLSASDDPSCVPFCVSFFEIVLGGFWHIVGARLSLDSAITLARPRFARKLAESNFDSRRAPHRERGATARCEARKSACYTIASLTGGM